MIHYNLKKNKKNWDGASIGGEEDEQMEKEKGEKKMETMEKEKGDAQVNPRERPRFPSLSPNPGLFYIRVETVVPTPKPLILYYFGLDGNYCSHPNLFPFGNKNGDMGIRRLSPLILLSKRGLKSIV